MAKTAKKKISKKSISNRSVVKNTAATRALTKKNTAKKATAKKTTGKKATTKKTVAKKVTTKKTVAKKATAKKTVAKKVTAKKTERKITKKKAILVKTEVKASSPKNKIPKNPTKNKKKMRLPTKPGLAQAVQNKSEKANASKATSRGRGLDLEKVKLPLNYVPSQNEEHMNPMQLLYFRNKLFRMRDELIGESEQTIMGLKSETRDIGDDAERASRETENILELRNRDRDRKMLAKVGAALRRIEDGTYGVCEDTDEPIPVARLNARPQTTLTVDAQERREMLQRQFRNER